MLRERGAARLLLATLLESLERQGFLPVGRLRCYSNLLAAELLELQKDFLVG